MADVANRDEALKCVSIARRALADGDLAKAEKFGQKAGRLYSCPEVDMLMAALHNGGTPSAAANGTPNGAAGRDEQPETTGTASAGPGARQRPTASPQNFARQRGAGLAGSTLENQSTPEQRQLVAQILRAKDYYEILAIEKVATDDDIKKGYRKLALKLHPDKNKAPRAEDAFKAVSKAFSCLSDPQKRAYYDRTGYESSSAAQAASNSNGAGRARGGMQHADEFDPEEIFNMFFGGGFNPQARVFRTHFGNARHGTARGPNPTAQSAEQQQRNAIMTLLQFVPVLLILFFTIFSGSSQPVFSLVQGQAYPVAVRTDRLKVPFFVKNLYEFEKGYPQKSTTRLRLERQIESEFYDKLSVRCQQERLAQNRLWTWGRSDDARKMDLPSCAEIDKINLLLGMRRGTTGSYYGY